jgi:hypothetical protein
MGGAPPVAAPTQTPEDLAALLSAQRNLSGDAWRSGFDPSTVISPVRATQLLRELADDTPLDVQGAVLHAALPNLTTVNFDRFEPDRIMPETRALAQLGQDYPQVMLKLNSVGFKAQDRLGGPSGVTVMYPGGAPILIEFGFGYRATDVMSIADALTIAKAKRWTTHNGDAPGSTVVHEFGHVISHYLDAQAGMYLSNRSFQMQLHDDMRAHVIPPISRYGLANTAEAFADAFQAYYHGSVEAAALRVGAYLASKLGSAPRAAPP